MTGWIRVLIGAGASPRRGALPVAALALLTAIAGCGKEEPNPQGRSAGRIEQVATGEQLRTRLQQADKPVLVDFYATWCSPCKILAPIIESLAGEYEGRAEFVKIDGDRAAETLPAYNIRAYPTVVVFSNGEPVERLVGLYEADAYRAALDKAIATAKEEEQ